jgi:hypothetical protein
MPYRTSRARVNLKQVYVDIQDRLKIVDSGIVDTRIREYVLAAAIFLAHAEIENYLADILSGFATALANSTLKGSSFPGHLQAHFFLTSSNAKAIFGNFMSSGSEKDFLQAFTNALKGKAGRFVNDRATIPPLFGNEIYDPLKYPSKDNLKKLFFRLGIKDVFNTLSSILKQDSLSLLTSLGDLRTQLAHTGTLPGVSAIDVRNRIDDTNKLISALDRTMYQLTAAHFGQASWNKFIC